MVASSRQRFEPATPYVVALACTAAGIVLRMPMEPWLAGTQVWLTFWPAAFIAAWFGGARAGIVCVLLSLVVVTGYGRESDRERALASGFDEHLVKPVDLARLDELIREMS